jgi:antitoxin CcdA
MNKPAAVRGDARKHRTTLSLDADLTRRARGYGLNLSEIAEKALAEAVRREAQARWRADNEAAIDTYNEQVARRGPFSDALRRF